MRNHRIETAIEFLLPDLALPLQIIIRTISIVKFLEKISPANQQTLAKATINRLEFHMDREVMTREEKNSVRALQKQLKNFLPRRINFYKRLSGVARSLGQHISGPIKSNNPGLPPHSPLA